MDQENLSLKEIADKLMEIKGNVRGEVIRNDFNYIRYREGEEGVRKVEEKLKELGYPLKFKEIRPMEYYPEALSVLVIFLAKEIFQWTESDIFDMGNSAPKYSFFTKLLMRYFLSLKKCFEESPNYWKAHFDFGSLETVEFNEKEKYAIIRIKGYKFLPIMCFYHAGYFLRIVQFILKNENPTIEETKCVYKGAPYHEYKIKWK